MTKKSLGNLATTSALAGLLLLTGAAGVGGLHTPAASAAEQSVVQDHGSDDDDYSDDDYSDDDYSDDDYSDDDYSDDDYTDDTEGADPEACDFTGEWKSKRENTAPLVITSNDGGELSGQMGDRVFHHGRLTDDGDVWSGSFGSQQTGNTLGNFSMGLSPDQGCDAMFVRQTWSNGVQEDETLTRG